MVNMVEKENVEKKKPQQNCKRHEITPKLPSL